MATEHAIVAFQKNYVTECAVPHWFPAASVSIPAYLVRVIAGAAVAAITITPPAIASEADPVGQFAIRRFQVEGNTLLPATELDRILDRFTGTRQTFADVQQALEALEAAYQARGYNVVQVMLPEQELNQGVVTLRVIETTIGSVRIEGQRAYSQSNIRRSVPSLVEGQTPNLADVSASLKLANENIAKKLTLQLQSGATDEQVDAVLKVADSKPWRVSASVDNSGSESTGKTQLTTQFQHANVADLDHVLSLQYSTTVENPSQVNVYGIGYHVPLYGLGDSLDFFASYSDVDSGSVLAGLFNLQVSGRGAVYGVRYNQHLRRVGAYESRLTYGLDYKAFRNNVTLEGAQLGNDVSVHPVSLTYAGSAAAGNGEVRFSIAALHNLPGGSRGSTADFNRVRAGAPASYGMIRYQAAYSHAWPADWLMQLNLSGQYSPDALVPGEQFGAGGAASVRGFAERAIADDKGFLVNAEVYTPNFCAGISATAVQCRGLAFYDAARVRRNDALPGEIARASIASAGVGVRMNVSSYVTLQMDYGRVLNGSTTTAKGDSRVHVRLGMTY